MVAIISYASNSIDGPCYMGVIKYKIRICFCFDYNGRRYKNGYEIT